MLNSSNILRQVANLSPFLIESIWIGKLNNIRGHVCTETSENQAAIKQIESGKLTIPFAKSTTPLEDNSLVKCRDSIKNVVGIITLTKAGLDQ